jgi:RHS repeat-associated protein
MDGGNYVSGYDIWGNLKIISPDPSRPGCSVPGLGLTVNTKNQIADPGFAYDAAGNLTATPNPGGLAMQYDAENRITTTSAGVTYTYDGDGKRVKKSDGTLYWFGNGLDALAESDLAGNISDEYAFFGGKRIARRQLPSGTLHFYFSDHLGSSNIVASATGTILDESDFYPFGGERIVTASTDNPYLFTGKERDSESGLDYFGARYYSSALGRFASPDPLMASARISNPQTWNRYSYALNNPLRFIDPLGMAACDDKNTDCITVKVNVIYDQNANEGKGLTDDQKKKFEEQVLKNAQSENGDSNVKLDVTYTPGGASSDGKITGIINDAINVIVSDHTPTGDAGVSGRSTNGAFLTSIDINAADGGTLSHELAHHILGDTSGLAGQAVKWLASLDPALGEIANRSINAVQDVRIDALRMGRLKYNPGTGGLQPISDFSRGALNLSQLLTTQQAIRPTQK